MMCSLFLDIVLGHQYYNFEKEATPIHTQITYNGLQHDKHTCTRLEERAKLECEQTMMSFVNNIM